MSMFSNKMTEEKKEITLKFIEDYKSFPQLWDQSNKLYRNKIKRNEGLNFLATKYKLDLDGVKKKIKCLRSYFAKEHHKVTTKMESGVGSEEVIFDSPWFAYKSLLFIADAEFVMPKETRDISYYDEEFPEETEEDESNDSLATPAPEDERQFFIPIQTKRIKMEKDEEQTYTIMKNPEENTGNKDGCTIFGELIASKLRNLSRRNRIIAERRIYSIFYDLELEEIEYPLNH